MQSTLRQCDGDKMMAEKYSQLNNMQMVVGKRLLLSLNIKHGESLKVLDMGCGTGELTTFIADALGSNSEVVGVDPILERISIAKEKHHRPNLTFLHGDSASAFVRNSVEHYDIHFSNYVFNWVNPEEKKVFIETAFGCLKPGGKIAMISLDGLPDVLYAMADLLSEDENHSKWTPTLHLAKKTDVEVMLKNAGFVIISSEYKPNTHVFESVNQFLGWICATLYIPHRNLSASEMEEFSRRFCNKDGTVTMFDPLVYEIIAMKPE